MCKVTRNCTNLSLLWKVQIFFLLIGACTSRCNSGHAPPPEDEPIPGSNDDFLILSHLGFESTDFPDPTRMASFRTHVPSQLRIVFDQESVYWSSCSEDGAIEVEHLGATRCSPTRPRLGPVYREHWATIVSVMSSLSWSIWEDDLKNSPFSDMAVAFEVLFEHEHWTIIPTSRTRLRDLRMAVEYYSGLATISIALPAKRRNFDGRWTHLRPVSLDLFKGAHVSPGVVYWPPIDEIDDDQNGKPTVFILSLCHKRDDILWGAYVEEFPEIGDFPLPPMYSLADHDECS